jgi:uncharacterized protein YaeQ
MAQPSIVHRFQIELSDSDRGIYQTLSFRMARHPSETESLFATRLVAYCLNVQDGLEIMPGISEPEQPAFRLMSPSGEFALWVEVGFPDAKRLHKAGKLGGEMRVYLHREPFHYLRDLGMERVHRREEIAFFSFQPHFLEKLGRQIGRDTNGTFVVTGGTLYVDLGSGNLESEVIEHRLSSLDQA